MFAVVFPFLNFSIEIPYLFASITYCKRGLYGQRRLLIIENTFFSSNEIGVSSSSQVYQLHENEPQQ